MLNSVRRIGMLTIAGVLLSSIPFCQAQSQASCTFTRFNVSPNATPIGINSFSTVVGRLTSTNGSTAKGFIRYSGGGVNYYSAPNVTYSFFTARSDAGVAVGIYGNPGGTFEGFMLNGSTFTPIVDPNSGAPYGTRTTGINKWNTIVGYYATSTGTYHGFRRYSNGSYGDLNYPGGQFTQPNGINNSGMVAGSYSNSTGEHGFVYYKGQWATVDYPGSNGTTQALGISDAGVILAVTTANEPYTYFLDESGTFKVISDSSSSSFEVDGIGPSGLIIGSESLPNGSTNQFIARCN